MKLLDTFNALEDAGIIGTNIDSEIQQNLKFNLRPYQKKVICRFDYYISNYNQEISNSFIFSYGDRFR